MCHQIVTHSQRFHADEVMAIALLDLYFFNGEKYKITRTREQNVIEKAKNSDSIFVIDVGLDHNEEKLNFDHHQQDNNLKWEDGIPLSSCGMIWKWLRKTKKLHQKMNEETMDMVENHLIKHIDAQDNGVEKWADGNFITFYNRKHDDSSVQDKQFIRALKAAKDYFINFFYDLRAKMKSEKEIQKAIKKSEDIKDVVVFDSNVVEAAVKVRQYSDKSMIVLPHSAGKWIIRSVPEKASEPYSIKCPAPKQWRGLSEKELQEISNINGLIFCHKKGFMSIFEGSKEEAIYIAREIYLYNILNNK